MLGVLVTGVGLLIDWHQSHKAHQPPHTVAPTLVALPFHMPRHLTRPVPRRLQKLLIDDVHKPQVFCTLALRTIIQVRPHERQQHALATNARFMILVHHFCLASRAVELRHRPKNPGQQAGRSSNAACQCQRNLAYRASYLGAQTLRTCYQGQYASRTDLPRMHAVLLRQLRKGQLLTDRFKRNPGLEIGRVVLSLRHFGSLLSSVNPPSQMVRNSATTSDWPLAVCDYVSFIERTSA